MSYNGIHVLRPGPTDVSYKKWYDRKFAFLPVMCNGERVWFRHYYIKHERLQNLSIPASHIFRNPLSGYIVESQCITEADYIVDKLTEGF